MERTVYKGRRWSTANAYLKPALKRQNLTIVHGLAEKVRIENKRATGVEIARGGSTQFIKAHKEVVIAASAFNSPKLLMLSGIGPAKHLKEHGIKVIADRPGVGANLMDHLELYIQQECTQPVSLYSRLNLFQKGLIGLEWLLFKTGDGATNHFEASAFVRSKAGIKYPDIQYHFLPVAIRYDGKAAAPTHGFQAHVGPMRSKSRGQVRLNSSDPKAKPSIQFNYMSHEDDFAEFRHCIRLTREIFQQQAFDQYRGYHPCGTAKMGDPNDKMSVVDPECRVIGVEGLRLADSSIFPRIPNGNLNAPSIMVGEKAADHILGKDPLPRSNQEPWINPDWETSDRVVV